MRPHTTRPCDAERTTDVIVRKPSLMHLGICALILGACGGESGTAPSDTAASDTVPPPTFTLVGHGIPTHQLTSDVWVHGTVAYTGMEDVDGTGTAANTLLVWDVSNPATPVLASSLVVDGVGSVVDVMIRADGTLGVIAHEGDGITLLDLSNPLSPQVITRFFNADGLPVLAHNIWIEGDYVYATEGAGLGEGGRLTIIDISNPADPQVVAGFYAGSDSANDVYVRDGLAFVSQGNAGLVIVDVGNGIACGSPTNPVEVGRVQILSRDFVRRSTVPVHNAWYWPDAGYVFVGNGLPLWLRVVDVSELSNPVEVATVPIIGSGVFATRPRNFWLDEARGIRYVAWWSDGLKAFDVSGELLGELNTQEQLVGSILFGNSSAFGQGGEDTARSWGVQLHDGLVYVSEVTEGLWIFRPEF